MFMVRRRHAELEPGKAEITFSMSLKNREKAPIAMNMRA
jgi:hypothetical protein